LAVISVATSEINPPLEAPFCCYRTSSLIAVTIPLYRLPPTPTSTTASLRNSSATFTLQDSHEEINGHSPVTESQRTSLQSQGPVSADDDDNEARVDNIGLDIDEQDLHRGRSPPPRYPYAVSAASGSTSFSLSASRPAPPPFCSLYDYASAEDLADDHFELPAACSEPPNSDAAASPATAAPAYAPSAPSFTGQVASASSPVFRDAVVETKRALPQDNKASSSTQKNDDSSEPPPAYEEGYSPLLSFSYLMAAAGGTSSIITQVQQGGPPINAIGGKLWAGPSKAELYC
jgi:hypothetical protein